MKYNARALGADTELSVEKEGLRIGSRFVDYADFLRLTPMNHRVFIDTLDDQRIEISMLGYSYDGFWQELTDSFGKRSLEALFVDETQQMACQGEFVTPEDRGRGAIALYPDAVVILPDSAAAVRIPLCFLTQLHQDGYLLHLSVQNDGSCTVGRMGYDTMPFFERVSRNADRVKKLRAQALSALTVQSPYTRAGLFRTAQTEQYWRCAFGPGVCALELFTGEDAATYLYRFSEPEDVFFSQLQQAMEAMGTHREIIYYSDEQLSRTPLYSMSVQRSAAVRFLRSRSAGRLIHSANHTQRLQEFLAG